MNIKPEIWKEILHYDPDTGTLAYKRRGREWFKSDISYHCWNGRYAGKFAGSKGKANSCTYLMLSFKGRRHMAHRVAWAIHYGEFPHGQIDHIDGNSLNNKLSNLRVVDNKINNRNRRIPSNNTSGHIGVHRKKSSGKWESHIEVDGVKKHLGCFEDFDDAVAARIQAQKKYGFSERHGCSS